MKFTTLHEISGLIAARKYAAAARHIDSALDDEPGANWHRDLGKLASFLRDTQRAPFSDVFKRGNGKLPFLSFSVLPGVSCPGAGVCLDWCYSFKAWRYPAAYARQAQNMVLIQSAPGRILNALDDTAAPGERIDFRLYVDGDFDSVKTVEFWFKALIARPYVKAYGYSKSLSEILAYAGPLPGNYRLNLSSGHNAPDSVVNQVRRLDIYRGDFLAIDVGYKVTSAHHGQRSHQAKLRQVYGGKAFTCPGNCGDCTPAGHACGSSRFDNIDIIIAAH